MMPCFSIRYCLYVQGIFLLVVMGALPLLAQGKILTLWERGISLVAADKTAEAREVFLQLFNEAPDYYPEHAHELSPKIMDIFAKARDQFFTNLPMQHTPLLQKILLNRGELIISLYLADIFKPLLREVTIYIRLPGDDVYRSMSFKHDVSQNGLLYKFSWPSLHDDLFYYVELTGRYGAAFWSLGTFQNPLYHRNMTIKKTLVSQANDDKTSFIKSNWHYLLGSLVAILGTATYGLMRSYY